MTELPGVPEDSMAAKHFMLFCQYNTPHENRPLLKTSAAHTVYKLYFGPLCTIGNYIPFFR